jgi:hypothetical protein
MSEIIQVLKEVQAVEGVESQTVIQVERLVQVVEPVSAIVYLNTSGGSSERYTQSFFNTSGFTVLATTHGIVNVKGVTVLDDQQIEMLADITINQSNQNVQVQFGGVNQTGTIIIF